MLLGKREHQKGNEAFRVGDNDEAYLCYSRSIAYDNTNPLVYSNRALVAVKLDKFDSSEDDCTRAIELDEKFIKAWVLTHSSTYWLTHSLTHSLTN